MKKLQRGFTLVEIIMVLGIAALITAAVFIAVSGAQRSARDTQRRADAQKLATAIEQYTANNNGKLPDVGIGLAADNTIKSLYDTGYLDRSKFKDPSKGVEYSLYARTGSIPATDFQLVGSMFYVKDSPTTGQYTIVVPLESGKYNYTP